MRHLGHWLHGQTLSLYQVLQLTLVTVGLGFTVVQLWRAARAARVNNLLQLTKNHRELWTMLLENPDLRAVLHSTRTVNAISDLTADERLVINFFLLHMAAAYELERARLITRNTATATDIAEMLSLPAFHFSWQQYMRYHPPRFRRYVTRAANRIEMDRRRAERQRS